MKTIQEILEGLRTGTIQEWLKQAKADLEKAKHLFAYESNLAKLTEYHTQYHTTVWAIRALQSELKRRNELAEANRKALGLDQPDLGESLWLEGYGEQLDPDQERRLAAQKRICEKLDKLPPMVTPPKDDPRWETLVHIDGEALEGGSMVSIARRLQKPQRERVCGNCANRITTPEYPDGWCSWGWFPASANGAGPKHCGKFDPLPLPQTPPAEAIAALDSLPTQEEFDPNDPRR